MIQSKVDYTINNNGMTQSLTGSFSKLTTEVSLAWDKFRVL